MPPEASSNVDYATAASPTADVRGDIWSLPGGSDEATTILAEMQAQYDARARAPIAPQTPQEFALLLAERQNNPEWARKLLAGDIATRDEFNELSSKAMGSTADAIANQPIVDTTTGDQSITRAGLNSWATDARSRGFSDEAIYHFVNGGTFTRDTVATAQAWLPRMERDPSLLYPDWPQDRDYQMEAFKWIISAGTMDTP